MLFNKMRRACSLIGAVVYVLSKISKITGKSIRDIMNKNRMTNPNRISVGQRLSI